MPYKSFHKTLIRRRCYFVGLFTYNETVSLCIDCIVRYFVSLVVAQRQALLLTFFLVMGAQDDEQRDDPDVEVLTRFSEERERLNEVKRRKRRHRKKKGADGTQDLKGEVEMDEHIIPMEDLFQRYETSIERGLSSAKHAQVLERDGPNALTPPKITPWYVKFGRHLFGGFSLLLWIAAFLALCGFALDPNGQENVSSNDISFSTLLIDPRRPTAVLGLCADHCRDCDGMFLILSRRKVCQGYGGFQENGATTGSCSS